MKLIDALQPDSPYVFYSDDHGFCINTTDVMNILTMDKESEYHWIPCSGDIQKDDVIYRQEAIDAVKKLCLHYTPTKSVKHPHIDFVVEELGRLQSAQSQRNKGKWILTDFPDEQTYECSACNEIWTFITGTPIDNGAYFCPNCGADMRGE